MNDFLYWMALEWQLFKIDVMRFRVWLAVKLLVLSIKVSGCEVEK